MDNKDFVKKDLAMILKFDAQINYAQKAVVEKYYHYITEKGLLTTPHGKRYIKRLEQIISGDAANDTCIFCNSQTQGDTVLCPACMAKLKPSSATVYCRSCGSKMAADAKVCPACGKGKDEGYQYCAHCGKEVPMPNAEVSMPNMEALADQVKQKSKDLAEQAAKLTREKLQAAPDMAKAIGKLQSNPDVQKTMEKGKEQAKKAREKWRGLSPKKRIIAIVVCALFLLMVLGGVGGSLGGASGTGGTGGIFGGASGIFGGASGTGGAGGIFSGASGIFGGGKVESKEDAIKLAKKFYPETEGYSIIGEVHTSDATIDNLYFLFLQVGENSDDSEAVTNAMARLRENRKNQKFFSAYYMCITRYENKRHLDTFSLWIGEDGRMVESWVDRPRTRVR